MIRTLTTCAVLAGLLTFTAGPALADYQKQKKQADIVGVAADAGVFSTLIAAAKAADLVGALTGPGPLTVFAPTDDAFAKLPEGTVATLLKPENKAMLQSILLHHVVSGKLKASDVVAADSVTSVFGQGLTVVASDGSVTVGGATVVSADVMASNGVIHVIDSVILPKNAVQIAAGNGDFSTLVAAVKAAGLAEALSTTSPITIFAPTNAAFAKLPEGTVANLLKPENKALLQSILKYHVVAGEYPAEKVVATRSLKTLEGANVAISVTESYGKTTVKVGGATVVATDIRAANGYIHVIDGVILPPSAQ